jgi:hypothetical protein
VSTPAPIQGPPPIGESDLPALYVDVKARPRALELFEVAEALQAALITVNPIIDEVQAAKAAELRAQAQAAAKELDAERLDTTAGLRQLVDWWNATFNARTTVLAGLVKALDKALMTYMAEKARKQREEREALERAQREAQAAKEAEAAELGVEPPPPPPPIVIPPSQNPFKITGSHGASLGMRDNWKWRVVAIKKVPESLLVAPEERILKPAMNSLAKAKAKEFLAALPPGADKPTVIADAIPGIELYNDPVNASRTL